MREELGGLVGHQLVRAVLREEGVGPLVHEDAVADAAQFTAPVGDRRSVRLTLPDPAVDGGREEGYGAGAVTGDGGEVRVLEVHALRKPDAIVEQEVEAVQLRRGDRVVEQFRHGPEPAGDGAVGAVELGLPDGDLVLGEVHAQGAARSDVGAGGQGGGEEDFAGLVGQFVVGVEEHHELAARGLDAVVAGRADTAAVLRAGDDAHPGVAQGVLLGDGEGAVGGGVVDDDDLHALVGLAECGAQGAVERGARVVRAHDHGDRVRGRFDVLVVHRERPSASVQVSSVRCTGMGRVTVWGEYGATRPAAAYGLWLWYCGCG